MKNSTDQSFDNILSKFATNIYGSSKGKLRHELLLHYLHHTVPLTGTPLKIIDIGAGTGVMTAELARYGHTVVFNDLSAEAVDLAKQTFASSFNVQFSQQNLNELSGNDKFDLVVCHAVLEWLANPLEAIDSLVKLVKPEGYLSLSFFNQDAHRFGNILYGNFDYVQKDLKQKNTVRLNPKNAVRPKDVLAILKQQDIQIVNSAGIRCFHDYLQDRSFQNKAYEQLKALELQYGADDPYKWLGKYFHIIARKA